MTTESPFQEWNPEPRVPPPSADARGPARPRVSGRWRSGRPQSPATAGARGANPFTRVQTRRCKWAARDRFDRVRFMDGFATHFILSEREAAEAGVVPPLFSRPSPPIPRESDIPVIAPLLDPGPAAAPGGSVRPSQARYSTPRMATRLAGRTTCRGKCARASSPTTTRRWFSSCGTGCGRGDPRAQGRRPPGAGRASSRPSPRSEAPADRGA